MSFSVLPFGAVRIVLDYRPALRQRTGVGEFVHELARALSRTQPLHDELTILSTSWKDRVPRDITDELGPVRVVDRHLPVRALTWTWNHWQWPPAEWLAGTHDVVHAQTPLLIPSRRAARVITIHDLDFLSHPQRAEAEMRRDFPRLVRAHACRADHVVVSSAYTRSQVVERLGVPGGRVTVCPPGAPAWADAVARARRRPPEPQSDGSGHLLFIGTLEPRKNITGLLGAYRELITRLPGAPPLVLAGNRRASVERELEPIHVAPLSGRVHLRGYVSDAERLSLYRDARVVLLPSLEEGFGLPALEAMAAGVPVVVSNRGSLPEVVADAARPVDPLDTAALAREIERLLDDDAARQAVERGLTRASSFTWDACARAARGAYRAAIAQRHGRSH